MFYQNKKFENSIRAIKYVYKHGIVEPVHQHQVIQVLHIIKGVIRVYINNNCWVIPPSRGLLIPAGVPHSLISVGNVEVRTLFIDPIARADLSNEIGIFEVDPLLRELINRASDFTDDIGPNTCEDRIHELILDELRRVRFSHFNVAMPVSKELKKFCEKIFLHYARPWELADVASSLNVSIRTISRKFHSETGMSFGEWLRRFRLLKSMELMASGYSVTDAALAVGYESQSSFSMMFKKRVGVTPNLFVGYPTI